MRFYQTMQWALRLYAPENEPGTNPPGKPPETPPPGEKKYDDATLNDFLAKERKKTEAKFADYDELKAKVGTVSELQAKVTELTEQMDSVGKTAEQKERDRAAKETAKLAADKDAAAKERDTFKTELEAERSAHRSTRAGYQMTQALLSAGVLPQAADVALQAFRGGTDLEFDDAGNLSLITVKHDGTRHAPKDFTKAAEAFLNSQPWFAKPTPGGSGTRLPGGSGGSKQNLDDMNEEQLWAATHRTGS